MAVALSTFIAAIGFTAIQSYGKAVTRARNFSAQTQLITGMLTYCIDAADNGIVLPTTQTTVHAPSNWPIPKITASTSGSVILVDFKLLNDGKKVDFVGRSNAERKMNAVFSFTVPISAMKAQ